MRFLPLYFIVTLIISCNFNHDSEKKVDKKPILKNDLILKTEGNSISLRVSTEISVMRETPDPQSSEISRFQKGTELEFLNYVSSFSTKIKIQGIEYDEPWLKVKSSDGKIGWIYAGTISYFGLSDNQLNEFVLDRRLFNVFGKELGNKIKVYQKESKQVITLPAFRMLFERSEELRKQIESILIEKLSLSLKDSLPDFFWLNQTFPGFLVHYFENNSQYKLFRDFRYWNTLAFKTPESEDDLAMNVFLIAYSSDSIEYSHQEWSIELDNTESYSLLGRGIHLSVLKAMEKSFLKSNDFEKALFELKIKLLDDISYSDDFWEGKDKIIEELDSILASKFTIIGIPEQIELSNKRKKIENASEYNIRTGLLEGIEK